jgi:fimbrial chaperone protein
MRGGLFVLVVLAAASAVSFAQLATMPAAAMPAATMPATTMDVAPTTLDLKAGVPGLFYVTNHGERSVTVQIQAMDWRQREGRDMLSPSRTLLVSPPMVRIAPGARQSVRVMAKGVAGHARAFRLLVSQLPDVRHADDGVQVLLQFSVPVFVDHNSKMPPKLRWTVVDGRLRVINIGGQAVKLEGLAVNGIARDGLFYLLPDATRDLGAVTSPVHVSVRDGRTGRDLAADVLP